MSEPLGVTDTVHRSSLVVPELPGADVEICFLNYFLLKRGSRRVACRVTSVDAEGQKISARIETVTEPRVYRVPLSRMATRTAASHVVEFFAADDLVTPIPAVMINHDGPGFLNTVHAYSRVLNDPFEDDAGAPAPNAETSIDIEEGADTFVVFMAGAGGCRDDLAFELATPEGVKVSTVPLDVPRLCTRVVSLRDAFPDLPAIPKGVLSVRQPRQSMFHGRLLAGRRRPDGAFTANHSVDRSRSPQYRDDDVAFSRTYPFFADLRAIVRVYPIMAPGRLVVSIEAHDGEGRRLAAWDAGELESPGASFLDADIGDGLDTARVARPDVAAFTVRARPLERRGPTRINHQLLYGRDGLFASLNVGLSHPHGVVAAGNTGFAWGQMPVGGELASHLGIVTTVAGGDACDIAVTAYDEEAEIGQKFYTLPPFGSVRIDPTDFLPDGAGTASRRLWYIARAARSDLSAFTVTRHQQSGHSAGEHSF